MKKDLYIDGIHFLTAREAGDVLGYAPDYISRLCREGKLRGRISGKNWLVEADSLIPFIKQHEAKKQAWHQDLSRELKSVAEPVIIRNEGFEPLPRANVAPRQLHVLRASEKAHHAREVAQTRTIARIASSSLVAVLLLFVANLTPLSSFIANAVHGINAEDSLAAASTFSPIDSFARATFNGINTVVCSFSSWCDEMPESAVVYVRTPGASNVATAPTNPVATNITNNISNYIQPVVERLNGVSEQSLASRLLDLETSLTGRIDLIAYEGRRQTEDLAEDMADGIGGGGFENIDILDSDWTGGTITDATISGGTLSSITFSGTQSFSALEADTATVTNATSTNLYVSGSFGFGSDTGLLRNSAGSVSTLANGSNGQVLKMVSGNLQWATDLTGGGGGGSSFFATTSDSLAIYPADPSQVVIIGDSATTTVGNILEIAGNSLFRGAMTSYGNVTAPRFVATSSVASVIPYASTTAISSSYASTTLLFGAGLATCQGNNVLTWVNGTFGCEADDVGSTFAYLFPNNATSTLLTFNNGLMVVGSTTINGNSTTTGMLGVGSLFINSEQFSDLTGTGLQNSGGVLTLNTSGNWTGTFDGLEGSAYLANSFSTTSADYWSSLGFGFSTTSANYWQTTRDFFSTSSANYFLAQNQGNAFSTTSAINFVNSSTTIPKTYTANTFTSLQTFTNASSTFFSSSYASSTIANFGTICLTGDTCRTTWPTGTAYPFFGAGNSTSTLTQFNGGLTAYASSTIGNGTAAGGLTVNGTATTSRLVVLGTGTSTFAGDILMGGSIIPSLDNTYSLGSASNMWKDVYIGPGSLYVNGKKVIEDVSDTITFSTDNDQSLMTETSGVGTVTTRATGSGNANLLTASGNINLTSTSGNINIGTSGSGQLNLGIIASGTWNGIAIGDAYLTKSGNWTGTLDGYEASQLLDGSFSTTSASYFLAQNQGNAFSTTSAINFVNSSTTIPKTYTANVFTALQTFSNASSTLFSSTYASTTNLFTTTASTTNLTISGLSNGLLKVDASGVVSLATAGTDYANFGYLFPNNATSTLLSFNGGASTTLLTTTGSTYLATSGGNVGVGTTTPSAKLQVHAGTTVGAAQAIIGAEETGYWHFFNSGNPTTRISLRALNSSLTETMRFDPNGNSFINGGNVGIGTTSPYAKLSVGGDVVGARFVATTSTTSIFPYASTTALSATTLCLTGDSCIQSWPTGGGAAYPFSLSGNATSTLTQFNGGLTAYASSTIGAGGQATGLTINGGATTTGNLIVQGTGISTFAGYVGIGSSVTNLGARLHIAETVGTNSLIFQGGSGFSNERRFATQLFNGVGETNLKILSLDDSNATVSDNLLVLTHAGNIGIGTSTPSAKLTVFGDTLFNGTDRYTNFGTTTGTSGYGFRDNAGVMEFKNANGTWQGVTTATTGPSFNVHRNGVSQTITDSTFTTLDWTTEAFDTNNNFNLADDQFQPTVPGKYLVTVSISCNDADQVDCRASIEKNGTTEIAAGYSFTNGANELVSASTIVDMNGSTDYLEAIAYSNVSSGSALIAGNAAWTYFTGTMIAPINGNNAAGWANDGSASFLLDNADRVGVGTSTPWAKLAIQGDSGQLNPVFEVASSSTATKFLTVSSTGFGTTTLSGLNISGSATTTSNVGMNLTSGCYAIGGTCLGGGASLTGTTGQLAYFSGTNTAVGTSSLFIATNGNVGVGTTTPNYRLDVLNTSSILPGINIAETSTSLRRAAIGFGLNPAATTGWVMGQSLAATTIKDFYLYDVTAGATRFYVDTTGNVGIGTTTPNSKLTVYGDTLFNGTDRYTNFGTTTGSSGYGFRDNAGVMEFKNANGTWQGVTTATTGPSFFVHKNGTNQTVTAAVDTLATWSTETFDTNNNFASNRFTPTVPGKYLVTFNVYILSSPSYVHASIYKNGSIVTFNRTTGSSAIVTAVIDMNGSTDYLEAYVESSNTSVSGLAHFTNFSGAMIAPVNGNNAAGWANDGSASFLLDNADKVGVGTTTPWAKLAIQGDSGQLNPVFEVASSSVATKFLSVSATGFGTTTLSGLNVSGSATSTSNVGFNLTAGCFAISNNCLTLSSLGGSSYPFSLTGNATSTLTQFNGGLTAYASSTIGAGGQATGLTINGGATTTGLLNVTSTGTSTFSGNLDVLGALKVGNNSLYLTSTSIQNLSGSLLLQPAGGNVGIGTSSPSSLLHLSTGSPRIILTDTDTGANNWIDANSGVGILGFSADRDNTVAGSALTFAVDGTESMRIIAGGNVGVGTTSPWAKLSIESTAGIPQFVIGSSTATQFIVNASGRVGISTTSPDYSLTISSAFAGDGIKIDGTGTKAPGFTLSTSGVRGPEFGLALSAGHFLPTSAANDLIIDTNLSSNILLGTGGTERMRINSSGNVGIGTTTPDGAMLHLETPGDGSVGSPHLRLTENGDAREVSMYNRNGGLYLITHGVDNVTDEALTLDSGIASIYTGGTERFRINASGNVGIGTTSPTAALTAQTSGSAGSVSLGTWSTSASYGFISLNGRTGTSANFYSSLGDGNLYINRPTGDDIRFREGNTDQVTIETGGNVGIGTTDPGALLDVGVTGAVSAVSLTGNIILKEYSTSNVSFITAYDSSGAGDLGMQLRTQNAGAITNGLFISAAGNVGIGNSAPGQRLDVTGNIYTSASLYVGQDSSGSPADENVVGAIVNATGYVAANRSGSIAGYFGRTNDGNVVCYYAAGTAEGCVSITGTTVAYGAFTGAHYGTTEETIERGMLVELDGTQTFKHGTSDSEPTYGIRKTTGANSPAVFGSFLALTETAQPHDPIKNPFLIMAVGNGDMWVVQGEEESIEPGDYLISSNLAGHAMKDPETYMVSHIVAKAAQKVDWSTIEAVGGVKRTKISVTFEQFDRNATLSDVLAAMTASTTATSTEETEVEEFAHTFMTNLFARMTMWLADAGNGITEIFAKTLRAENVYADTVNANKLCLEDICVTKAELQQMLSNSGTSAVPEEPTPPSEEPIDEEPVTEEPSPEGPETDTPETPAEPSTPDPVEPEEESAGPETSESPDSETPPTETTNPETSAEEV